MPQDTVTPGETIVVQLQIRCQKCDKPWIGAGFEAETARKIARVDGWSDETGEWQCPEHKPNPETHRRY